MTSRNGKDISIIIPTFGRHKILIQTIESVLKHMPYKGELIVVDQNERHPEDVAKQLAVWQEAHDIELIKLSRPHKCVARNVGATKAQSSIVLFLDDDVIISPHLMEEHLRAHNEHECCAVVGEIYQWRNHISVNSQIDAGMKTRPHYGYGKPRWITHLASTNVSLEKEVFTCVGGFDENFVGAAHAEDDDLGERLTAAGHRVLFHPNPWIVHLRAPQGGCRIPASTWPEWTKSVGTLIYAFRHGFKNGLALQYFKIAVRQGPLRRENVVKPWRWGTAWTHFFYAVLFAFRQRNRVVSSITCPADHCGRP